MRQWWLKVTVTEVEVVSGWRRPSNSGRVLLRTRTPADAEVVLLGRACSQRTRDSSGGWLLHGVRLRTRALDRRSVLPEHRTPRLLLLLLLDCIPRLSTHNLSAADVRPRGNSTIVRRSWDLPVNVIYLLTVVHM